VVIVRNELVRRGLLPADKLPYGPDMKKTTETTLTSEEK